MDRNKKILWGVVGTIAALGVAIGIRYLIKQSSKDEKKSGIGGERTQRAVFTLTNLTNKPQVQQLFNSRTNIQNPNVGISPSIKFFNETLLNKPKKLEVLEFRAMGNNSQAEKSFKMICKDASGNQSTSAMYPLMSTQQFQKGMTGIAFDDTILDGECFIDYTLLPKSRVAIVVYYKKLKK